MNKLQFILLLSIAIQTVAFSCSCEYYEPVFCRAVNESQNIVRVVVTSHPDYHLMEVKVIENINKEIIEDTIVILGQDGINCGESLGLFSIQDTLILAVSGFEIYGEAHWYLDGACGIGYLRITDGLVKGQITDSLTSQPLQAFRDNLVDCLEMESSGTEAYAEGGINIFPNPVRDHLSLQVVSNSILEVKIFQLDGRLVYSKLNLKTESIEFNLSDLTSGIYYIIVKSSKGIITRRFFKE